jgi:peptide deformylase
MISIGIAAMSFLKIVTIGSPEEAVLKQKTEDIRKNEFPLARDIAEKLFQALTPYLPAAGLAAPQIGISKSIFIFSYDRDPKNLEVVINPSFTPLEQTKIEGWEGCFSVILSDGIWKLAKVPRYENIKATYFNLEGEKVEKNLRGFAAKVFQHEYDHLQGIENIERADAEVKSFDTKEELFLFMQNVKKEDSLHYKKP